MGENIEPQPIEDACLRSLILTNYVGGTGSVARSLGPNLEALQQWAVTQNRHLRLPEEGAGEENLLHCHRKFTLSKIVRIGKN